MAEFGATVYFNNMKLIAFCREYDVDEIVVAVDERRRRDTSGGLPLDDLIECRLSGINVCDIQQFIEREACKVDMDLLRPSWIAFADGFVMGTRHRFLKRVFDILVSVLLLLIAWPVMLLVAIAIWAESGAPVIYLQERVGWTAAVQVMKFRSMRPDTAEASFPVWARQDDPRVTQVGAFIRKSRLDELPQLFNVLKGDMSFVGPRPERP